MMWPCSCVEHEKILLLIFAHLFNLLLPFHLILDLSIKLHLYEAMQLGVLADLRTKVNGNKKLCLARSNFKQVVIDSKVLDGVHAGLDGTGCWKILLAKVPIKEDLEQ